MSIEQQAAGTASAAYAPVNGQSPSPFSPAPANILQPYPSFANPSSPVRKSRAIGLAAMIAAIAFGGVSTLVAAIIGASINSIDPSESDSATLVIGWLFGTAIGLPVLTLGILAIPLNRGRVFGIIAVSLAIAAPIVSFVVLTVTAALVQGA